MVLNMQQQITIAEKAVSYDNDHEAVTWAICDFNVSLQPSTVEKVGKTTAGSRKYPERKTPGRPCSSADAATARRILEAFDTSPQKSTRQAALELDTVYSGVFRALCREKYHPFKRICNFRS